jgi:CHAT domain-containing protein
MLVLDGVLRYLPMAALHDGQQYLVEQYALALYTEAARTSLVRAPAVQWRGAALGVSRGFPEQQFQPLPAVPGELDGIVRPEVLPGSVYLDEQFTLAALRRNLSQPVLHIASHFRFIDGSDESYLLLGDGSRLTLRDVRLQLPALRGVDLLTLSACDTATGGGLREDGREVEGLGVEAQRKGARAVLASLWPVADQSTGLLMQQFYRIRQQSQAGQQVLNKARALRLTQVAMLGTKGTEGATGQLAPAMLALDAADARGAKPLVPESSRAGAHDESARAFLAPQGQPYAHPYYWAPFILMGNWL